jgi:putative peptide zinc metalloprotease protein
VQTDKAQNFDHRIRDLGMMALAVRTDLVFTPRTIAGESCYIVEDAVNSKYYSIGIPEYTFISCLDGSTSVSEALSMTARAVPDQALTEQDTASICRWLIDSELAFTAASAGTQRLADAAASKKPGGLSKWNPLYLKLPLCYPDRFFTKLRPWIDWLYSKPMVITTLALIMIAAYQVLARWNEFIIASQGIFAPGRWLWLGLCWLVLKIVHECSHGAVCKRFGGTVHESGAIFILFAPLAYVDVTSSWRFKSKWHRIYTAAAGMYIELLVAAIAALFWVRTDPGLVNDLCFNVVLMASLTTLAFNANPLMRFDGYYILSDLVDIPNLYSDGQLVLQHYGRKLALGLPSELDSSGSKSRDTFIKLYGVAAFFWRTSVTFFLILAAAMMFDGAGLLIALFAAALWLLVPTCSFLVYLFRGTEWEKPKKLRFVGVVVPLVLLLGFAITHTPWPGVTRAPAVVEYEPLAVVRAGSNGFVREVFVHSGQAVEEGQLIARLENEQLQVELHDVQLSIQQSLKKARVFKQRDELAAFQAEQKKLESLRKQLDEKSVEVAQLEVRAPISGTVIARDPDALLGTYASSGDEIVSIGDEQSKELRLSITQEDVDTFLASVGNRVSARLQGGVRLESDLTRVPPQASLEPPHRSLCSPYGGPLEVRPKESTESSDPEDKYELVRPGFMGFVKLPTEYSAQLRAGQRGAVWLARGNESIAGYLWGKLKDSIPHPLARRFDLAP